MSTTVAVADGIFTVEDGQPRLLGSRCVGCGNHMFPRQSGCPKCMTDKQEDVELATSGTLWSWTVQAFPPKAPPYPSRTGTALDGSSYQRLCFHRDGQSNGFFRASPAMCHARGG